MERIRIDKQDIVLCLSLVLILGFQTNKYSFEKNASTLLILVLFFVYFLVGNSILDLKNSKKYIIWYSVFTVYSCISSLWSIYNNGSYIYALVKDTYVPLVAIIVLLGVHVKKGVFRIINCLIVAELIAVLRAFINTPILKLISTMDTRLIASGLGVNYNNYSTQLTLVALIATIASFYKKRPYRAIFVILFLLIAATGSRKAIIIVLAGVVVLYCVSGSKNTAEIIKRVIFILSATAIVLLALYKIPVLYDLIGNKLDVAIQSILNKNVTADRSTDLSLYARSVLRESAFEQFKQHPIGGLGYNGFSFTNRWGYYAHNNYLELLASLGLFGFCSYYWLYVYEIANCLKHLKNNKISLYTLIFILMLIGMEYAQVTYMRPFAIIPLVVILMCSKEMIALGDRNVQ